MEGNPAMMESCRRRETPASSEMSGLTGENSRDFVEDEEMGILGFQMAKSMFTEWTDEKHSLYLNSMEDLFVKQLYNHKYHSTDLHGWHPKNENLPNPNSLRSMSGNSRVSSGQFKVVQAGCWQKINFERAQPQLDVASERRVLLKNPWIQHFRSADKHAEVTSAIQQENGGSLCSQAVHSGGTNAASCGIETSSKQLLPCQYHLLHQNSVGSYTEVSDQNFVNGDTEDEDLSTLCRTKRMKTVVADFPSEDQVVLFGKSPVIVDPHGNCASLDKEEQDHGDSNEKMWID